MSGFSCENPLDNLIGETFRKDWSSTHNPLCVAILQNLIKAMEMCNGKEWNGYYEAAIDLPGWKEGEVYVSPQGGYSTIRVAKELDKNEVGRYRLSGTI